MLLRLRYFVTSLVKWINTSKESDPLYSGKGSLMPSLDRLTTFGPHRRHALVASSTMSLMMLSVLSMDLSWNMLDSVPAGASLPIGSISRRLCLGLLLVVGQASCPGGGVSCGRSGCPSISMC